MDETAEYRSTVVSAFENRPQADTAVSELCRAGFREDQIRVEEARYYGESESDRTVVTVKADGRYDEATTILLRHGAFDLHTAAHAPRIAEGAERIQLREEELQVHKQLVETGKVRVRKEVVTEHRTIEVPVQWEEIVIERHAPNGAPVPDSDIGPGEEIHIPVRREQVFVEKRPVVKEEVTVGKRVVQDTEHVGGEVRKEEVRIERVACEGDGDMHTAAPQGTTTAPGSAPAGADTGATASRTGEGARIQLREEELQVHKQLVETGKVRVRKEVVTEHRTIEVPVQREEIVIERHAPNGAPVPDSDIGPGEEIHIPVRREQVFVEKRPVVKEEVTVGKRVVQDTEHVGGEVRKEEVRIERVAREGDGDVHTAAPQGTTTAPGSAPAGADTGAMAAPTAERTERAQFRADQAASGKGPNAVGKEGEEAMILHRAYLKWLDEGCPDGQELRHYFEAAQEVRA